MTEMDLSSEKCPINIDETDGARIAAPVERPSYAGQLSSES